jgi:hypothetical protein
MLMRMRRLPDCTSGLGFDSASGECRGAIPSRHVVDRMKRRFAGILTGICALYLTVGAVEAPCIDHDWGGPAGSVVAGMSHQDSHHESSSHKSEQQKPCKTAAIPCCIAMTSCGATIALGAAGTSDTLSIEAQIVAASHLAQPLTRIAAPEPPPPKA